MKKSKKKILILSGPGGSGKTSIAELLVQRCNYVLLDADNEDTEFFPNGEQWFPKNSKQLALAHDKILKKAKKLFEEGDSVVVDYIIFGKYLDFFEKFRQEFVDDLEIKILFPSKEELIKRDKNRECWTTGSERIAAVYEEFEEIKDIVGKDCYIDTTNETPEMTFEKHFLC